MRLPLIVRRTAAAVIGRIPLRIRGGPNRGMRWTVASSGRGIAAGRFEARRVEALLRLLRPGDVVWDIGAHKGYVALAAARAVGPAGRVYALEPAAANQTYLRRHVAWNRATNVEVVPVAVGAVDGEEAFGGRGSSITFRLGQGDERVAVRTVATLLQQGLRRPAVLKIDVEGGELDVLRGAGDVLGDDVVLMIAVHSRSQYDGCRAWLEQRGFRVHRSAAMRRMMERLPDGWSPDPDLLAVGPAREVPAGVIDCFTGDAEC